MYNELRNVVHVLEYSNISKAIKYTTNVVESVGTSYILAMAIENRDLFSCKIIFRSE